VLDRTGQHEDALAAARQSVTLEMDNWRHHLRLGYTSWGEERLREARRTLALLPGFPLAHWLAASVYVARQAPAEAERELQAGLMGQEAEAASTAPARFTGIALHWLIGLLHLSRGDHAPARAAFAAELAQEGTGHLYARECCANTWYALGALELREGQRDAAGQAFAQALTRMPSHGLAALGVALSTGVSLAIPKRGEDTDPRASAVDRAIARAAWMCHQAAVDREHAAKVVELALADAPPGAAGWLLPVEPLLHVAAAPALWAPALARLRNRAA
jgi:tetratricopeptide (TPR) repeat protein